MRKCRKYLNSPIPALISIHDADVKAKFVFFCDEKAQDC
ncbi:hypothetical protein APHNP_0383 [Anaplasma phagocytophilum str. ApNP]|uniref:Uncharacterized protein n=1 Tax=Anaplasma phagocytophilum str. ApNP TaxID=1359153 RepID=A0A0F3NGA4_ANAPH|nr:hypothetical protein APHNP_0383 [Anaplasma phagocytophilum str. ApNP]